MQAHTAATDLLYGECETAEKVKQDIETAPVSEKMKALLTIARQVQQSGKNVTSQSVERAKKAGATDIEIHDTVLISAAFCMINRYVDGLGTSAPEDREFYIERGPHRAEEGYTHYDPNK